MRSFFQIGVGVVIGLLILFATWKGCSRNTAPATSSAKTPTIATAPATTAPSTAGLPLPSAPAPKTPVATANARATGDTGLQKVEITTGRAAEIKTAGTIVERVPDAKVTLTYGPQPGAKLQKDPAEIAADIAHIKARIAEKKAGRKICLRIIRETNNDSVRRQAESDLRTQESEIARLEAQLQQKSAN